MVQVGLEKVICNYDKPCQRLKEKQGSVYTPYLLHTPRAGPCGTGEISMFLGVKVQIGKGQNDTLFISFVLLV